MYCKVCGELIDNRSEKDVCSGAHWDCLNPRRHCTHCGVKETDENPLYGTGNYVFCQPRVSDCGHLFLSAEKDTEFQKYAKHLHKYDETVKEAVLYLLNSDDGRSDEDDVLEFINEVNTHQGYIVIYDDSDGNCWYEKKPDNRDVIQYVIENEHRVTLGMGCNQYVHAVIYRGKKADLTWD